MKNYDLLKVVASKLNGLQYPLRTERYNYGDGSLVEFCKENGIVICYGASDDLMELDGAIYEEYGCYDGGTICIDENGEEASPNDYYQITAIWAKDNISWQYEFEPKHEVFTVYEDAEIYCKGIVFFVDDLKRKKEGEVEEPIKGGTLNLAKVAEQLIQNDTDNCDIIYTHDNMEIVFNFCIMKITQNGEVVYDAESDDDLPN